MTYGKDYLPSQRKYFDVSAIETAPVRPKNDTMTRFLFVLAVLGLLLGAWLWANPESAKAKTIELRDCRTNEECLRLYCEGNTGYVQDSALTKLCHE